MPKTFKELGIPDDMIQGLNEMKIVTPTKIQEKAIPFLLKDGGDLIAQAQTGTGKTAAFGLPLLTKIDPARNAVQGLVIAPTRELAKQIGKQLFRYTKYTAKMFVEVVCGGDKLERQVAALQRPTHVVVATPGRLLELARIKALSLNAVQYLVLDEADEMLKMGFEDELTQIFELVRNRRSTWLFSATIPAEIDAMIEKYMSPQAHSLKIDRANVVNRDISHQFVVCRWDDRVDFVATFLKRRKNERGVIFCGTRASANELGRQLTRQEFSVGILQGELTQAERDKVMRGFKKGRTQYLIASDLAARGIDVEGLSFVIHYQLPMKSEQYTHRSGRTARAGNKGVSIALIDPRERKMIKRLEKELSVVFTEFH